MSHSDQSLLWRLKCARSGGKNNPLPWVGSAVTVHLGKQVFARCVSLVEGKGNCARGKGVKVTWESVKRAIDQRSSDPRCALRRQARVERRNRGATVSAAGIYRRSCILPYLGICERVGGAKAAVRRSWLAARTGLKSDVKPRTRTHCCFSPLSPSPLLVSPSTLSRLRLILPCVTYCNFNY